VFALALLSFTISREDFPRTEDWKHAEIIQTVEKLKKNPNTLSRVVVVSNAPYFHSNSFNVDLKEMGISNLDFKGVSKRRWFEFGEFILVKSGDIGPTVSIGEPVKFLANPEPWFNEVYQKKASWTLPDASEAVLYQQEPRGRPIGDVGLFNLTLTDMQIPNIAAKNVEIRAVPESKEKTGVGALRELSVRSGSLMYKGIELKNVTIRLIRPQVNLPLFLQTQEIQLLSLERLKPSAEIDKNAVIEVVKTKAKWLKDPILELKDGLLNVGGTVLGSLPIRVALAMRVDGNIFRTQVRRVSVAGVPMPRVLFSALLNRAVPLSPNPDMLYYLDIKDVKEENGLLKIIGS
jgi:hypothetical protein